MESYVITIENDTSNISNYINKYVPDTKIFKGVIGKDINLDTLNEITLTEYTKYCLRNNIPLSESESMRSYGALGCFLSHKRLWNKLVNSNNNEMLIMEDDVSFLSNFKKDYPNILEFLKNTNEATFIILGCAKFGSPNTKFYNYKLKEITSKFWGTQSYLINKKAAQILIDKSKCIDIQVDSFMSIIPGILKLIPNKELTTQKVHLSTILNPSLKVLVPNSNTIFIVIILLLIGIIIVLSHYTCKVKMKKYKCKIK